MSGTEAETGGLCVLSFDNGGPGTYSQLLILKEYMDRLASDLRVSEDDVYPADYFDLIGGVGFGGYVSHRYFGVISFHSSLAAFVFGHLRMNMNQAIDTLLAVTALLSFDNSDDDTIREDNSTTLKEFLERMLHARGITPDAKMNDINFTSKRTNVALYAATLTNITHPHIFRTYPSRGNNPNPTITEALCATMAIQSYFLPVKIGPRRAQGSFIGGAFGANNPTRLLLDEAIKVFGENRRVAQIISLGCGLPQVLSVNPSDTGDINRLLKEITMDCEGVANDLSTRLINIDAYLRLNVNRGMESFGMKKWDDLGAVTTHTATYLATAVVSMSVDSSLRRLRGKVGSVTLGRLSRCIPVCI
ncbi:hypothetical protein M408DRAFT_305863 [Serendipita vermifera MAFF 305830]|uniref:PNPLA domain-containing protein n=1 Tax=Serendipita vermifera MAFF 305830 TaxID=933852 RepID=A0A0C2WU49_SERVB|nr:hypothetical protein M408DRAFT_305863 [Serendipita vermifera MAFF 305830]